MNREIRFRGKTVDGERWIYGHYYAFTGYSYINTGSVFAPRVIPETVGQFTGLKDKNGVEIYEGDIVDTGDKDFGFKTLPVVFRECCFTYPHSTQPLSTHAELVAKDGEGITVIGNIHENKELLK
jgi:uncharacterized phage protein (TIGR01671 family)